MIKRITIITVLLAFWGGLGCFAADGDFPRLQNLSMYERTVLVIRHYEGLHVNKGVYVGYGHRIRPGDPYSPNEALSDSDADRQLRLDVLRLHNMFRDYGEWSWLLAALSYNVGPYALLGHGSVERSALLRALDSSEAPADIRSLYLEYHHWKGRAVRSILRRRAAEFELLAPISDYNNKK